jgi:hypothetical protein
MFNRLYEEVQKAGVIQVVDLNTPLEMAGLSKSSVLEITREFRPSPLHQMLDSFTEILDKIKALGMESELDDELDDEVDMQQIMTIIGWLRGEDGSNKVPMLAEGLGSDDVSVIFMARENFVLGTGAEFRGEMTLFGKVQELIPTGSSLDLLDLLKVLPPGVREAAGFGSEFKEAIHSLMGAWPKEFGGPIKSDAVIIEGPAVVITPVAAYTI